ncbi:germination protein [Paenibacillus baekrokdamisoli]|uniref:Germination protein n=1 Tax=Paenibacillus baekrokdamisoli TaxID=1712516 RepID=A0A3G9JGY0_9BACL|nr:germination protein [Paenibacillus baekrokdamisoli]
MGLLLLIPIMGCWDRKEIEDVGIVLGIGFDKPAKGITEQGEKGTIRGKHPIMMIHHIAIPEQFSTSGGGKSQKNYINLISKGDLVFENIRKLSTRTARYPSYEHLREVVISEDVARTIDFNNIINFLMRNSETRRSIRVMIAKGKARDVFEKEGSVRNPALELRELAENYHNSFSMSPEMKMGDMSENITGKISFVIQRVDSSKKETKIAGAAVIKGKTAKMIGWLGEEETAGLNWLKGQKKAAGIMEGVESKSGEMIVYEVRSMTSKIKPLVKGSKISFTVEIKTEGKLREDWVDPGNAFDPNFVNRAEQAIEISIKKAAERALTKTQKKFKVDVVGFGKKLSIKYPKTWKKVKKDWDESFSEIPIEVKVKTEIQEFGTRGTKKA